MRLPMRDARCGTDPACEQQEACPAHRRRPRRGAGPREAAGARTEMLQQFIATNRYDAPKECCGCRARISIVNVHHLGDTGSAVPQLPLEGITVVALEQAVA